MTIRKLSEDMETYLTTDDDDDFMVEVKDRLLELSHTDRTILLLYIELGSMKKVGEILVVSGSTISNNLKRIRSYFKDIPRL